MILITPMWQSQAWYPVVLNLCIWNPLLLPQRKDLLKDPMGNVHPLIENNSLRLVAWTISGKTLKQKEHLSGLQSLSHAPEDQGG